LALSASPLSGGEKIEVRGFVMTTMMTEEDPHPAFSLEEGQGTFLGAK
jgi:hypothetical protein